MSAKDSQFIERALVHPWMFWVFFWKWPRIVRQVCSEYDLVARDRDAAKAAHEQAVAANEKVRKWIHVTHQLDATADLRAIWTAGKRLSLLLAFFIATNAFSQAPPYLRNQWTTNANPIAVKVISTNGVQAATNVWELDFTNTASVSVNVVSNAGKVVFSFIGATNSGGSGSIVGATNLGLEMSGAQGLFMQTNNQLIELRSLVPGTMILFSTNSTNITIIGTGQTGSANLTNWSNFPTNAFAAASSAFWTNFSYATSEGGLVQGIANTNPIASTAKFAVNYLTNFWTEPSGIITIGFRAGSPTDGSNSSVLTMIGDYAGNNQAIQNSFQIESFGYLAGIDQVITNTSRILNFGDSAGASQHLTNTIDVYNGGHYAGNQQTVVGGNTVFNIGRSAGNLQSLSNVLVTFNMGYQAGASQNIIGGSGGLGGFHNIGWNCGNGQTVRNSAHIFNAGFQAGAVNGAPRIVSGSDNIWAIGDWALSNSKLTNCNNLTFFGTYSGTNLVLTAKTNIMVFGNLKGATPDSEEFWFGNTNNISRFPGSVVIQSATAPTVGQILTAKDTLGTVGWSNAPSGSGGGIASIFTNNVLAGGPGLTELGFTNSSTVRVAATTNAGRSTVSFDARTNDAGVFVVQGTTDNGLYVAQSTAIGAGSIRLGFTSPKLGLERPGAGHFIHYSTSSGDTTVDAVFGGAKVNLAINGTTKWQVANAGHFLATTDNTVDIGASGATRPRNAYVANVATTASFASAATNRVAITAAGYTNTLTVGSVAVNVDVYFDAATAALQDAAGNTIHTFQAGTNITAHLKPNWRLVGTTMAGTAVAH